MKSSEAGIIPNDVPVVDNNVVNVASVPLLSPFRYPGGKTWLVPRVRQWLHNLDWRPSLFIEPFAGGAIVGLTVALEDLADKVLIVELDEEVASVWQTILSDDCDWLAKRILGFDLTMKNVQAELARTDGATRELAFRTILKNRTFRAGILAPGSTLLRYGEAGRGIRSRWYPETLAKRIRAIHEKRQRIQFIHGDGLSTIREHSATKKAVFFIDPPYTAGGKKAGRRLYRHHALDHAEVFALAKQIAGDFVITYDYAPEIRDYARKFELESVAVPMKSTHHAIMFELLIGPNLDWIRKPFDPTVEAMKKDLELRGLRQQKLL